MVAMLLVSNRFRPEFADSVSALVQISPYLIDVADATLDDAVARAAQSVLNAYRHAYYNPYEQDEVIERIEAERGEALHFWCFYNDRRLDERDATDGPSPTAQEIRDARSSELYWADEISMPRMSLYFNVDSAPGATVLAMSADTRYFPPSTMESIVREVERAAVQTALDGSTPTGVAG
jgi:hypothetical protein